MNKKIWVISLGGSRIVPNEVDDKFIIEFKKLIKSHPSHKFVVVTGGGTTARKYMDSMDSMGKSIKSQSNIGIAVTRFHAKFLMGLFGKKANDKLPYNMKKVKNQLLKNQIVFCGALRYNPKQTSDGTAANIAAYLDCPFINLTNVKGLYLSNPNKNPNAKFVPKITWKKFSKMANSMKYSAGQHFVLDQSGSKIIEKRKVPTYIVGNLKDIERIVSGKGRFGGTIIEG
jgi:uridylate kinase